MSKTSFEIVAVEAHDRGERYKMTSGVRVSEGRKSLTEDIEGQVVLANLANMILAKGRSRTNTSEVGDEKLDQISRAIRR